MSKKIPIGLALALIIASITATFTITMSVSQRIYNNLIPNLYRRTSMSDSIDELNRIVNSNFYFEIDADDQIAVDAATARGYIAGLGDKYSRYFTAAEYAVYKERLLGNISGTGLTLGFDRDSGLMIVTDVAALSPAETSGILKGDVITAIEGETVTANNYADLQSKLEGQRFSTVDITYERDGSEDTVSVMIGYDAVTVTTRTLGDTGIVSISAFYGNTVKQLETAVNDLQKSGVKSLVLDVRNNSEGTVEYAVKCLDIFVPVAVAGEGNGAAATLEYTKRSDKTTYTTFAGDVALPIYVLVNAGTDGAAELFACDLCDFGKAQTVGEQTAGNASAQETFELSDGGAVLLTVAKVLPYTSLSYDGTGIVPNHEVAMEAEKYDKLGILGVQDDEQLSAALGFIADSNAPEEQ